MARQRSNYSWKKPWAYKTYHHMRKSFTEREAYRKLKLLERHSAWKQPYKFRSHPLSELNYEFGGYPQIPPYKPGDPGPWPYSGPILPLACLGHMIDCEQGGCEEVVCAPLFQYSEVKLEILFDPTGQAWVEPGGVLNRPKLCIPPGVCSDGIPYPVIIGQATDIYTGKSSVVEFPLTNCDCCCPEVLVTPDQETVNPGGTATFSVWPPCPDAEVEVVANYSGGSGFQGTVALNAAGDSITVNVDAGECGAFHVILRPTGSGCTGFAKSWDVRVNNDGNLPAEWALAGGCTSGAAEHPWRGSFGDCSNWCYGTSEYIECLSPQYDGKWKLSDSGVSPCVTSIYSNCCQYGCFCVPRTGHSGDCPEGFGIVEYRYNCYEWKCGAPGTTTTTTTSTTTTTTTTTTTSTTTTTTTTTSTTTTVTTTTTTTTTVTTTTTTSTTTTVTTTTSTTTTTTTSTTTTTTATSTTTTTTTTTGAPYVVYLYPNGDYYDDGLWDPSGCSRPNNMYACVNDWYSCAKSIGCTDRPTGCNIYYEAQTPPIFPSGYKATYARLWSYGRRGDSWCPDPWLALYKDTTSMGYAQVSHNVGVSCDLANTGWFALSPPIAHRDTTDLRIQVVVGDTSTDPSGPTSCHIGSVLIELYVQYVG